MEHNERNLELRRQELMKYDKKLPPDIMMSLWKKFNADYAEFLRKKSLDNIENL